MIRQILISLSLIFLFEEQSQAQALPTPEQVLADAARYTVKIQVQNEIAFNQDEGGASSGTGFLIDRQRGWILTNGRDTFFCERSGGKAATKARYSRKVYHWR